jgi:hypothetical protein
MVPKLILNALILNHQKTVNFNPKQPFFNEILIVFQNCMGTQDGSFTPFYLIHL